MTTKLTLYNGAIALMGDRPLVALTDNRESRRALDGAWDRGAVNYCLRKGLWNFAVRTQKIEADTDYTPTFGYVNAFTKPSDCLRVVALAADEFFVNPLNDYSDEAGKWFSNEPILYVSYVSNHADYGGDYSLWPETFTRYVENYLAVEAASRTTRGSSKKEALYAMMEEVMRNAKSQDAMDESAKFPPRGSWSRARLGSRNTGERRGD